ncbi:MAG: methylated-DNA--[protein]-cysteine S-methyltransferase [Betaproteobacteria bacterium]|nr:MAG: methylated-DNA--[protein]-cysteine S-methyltransferase [Betaproteobacteria bacterium]
MNGIAVTSPPIFDALLPAPFGAVGVRMAGERLAELVFLEGGVVRIPTPVRAVAEALAAYFEVGRDASRLEALSVSLPGTPFRQRVWTALRAIPVGQTTTYAALARQIGSSARAVGQALGDNPIPIIVPCHRVVGAQGLGGFMHTEDPFPLTVKRWLLSHEGYRFN